MSQTKSAANGPTAASRPPDPRTEGRRPASVRIIDEVGSWPGVEYGPGRRGELSFTVGRREIGHLHGDRAAHFAFPKDVWRELFAAERIVHHPVFPGKEGMAARAIAGDEDVVDVIELMRLNYDRAVGGGDAPATLPRLHPLAAERLPFAPELEVRAFLLERARGNILIYSTSGLDPADGGLERLGGVSRQYLNHRHEAIFAPDGGFGAPLFVHAADRNSVERRGVHVRGAFSKRHVLDEDFEVIPTPGHTPGATAYLWNSGEHRLLFTGDTLYLGDDGEWQIALLESSDREAYIASLELIRGLDFDVLVPWAASAGGAFYSFTEKADAERRIDDLLERLRAGEER